MVTLNEEILDSLRTGNYTAQELSKKFPMSINTIREFMDRMSKTGVVIKIPHKTQGQSGRPIIYYHINPNYARFMPYIKTFVDADRKYTIRPIDTILDFYDKGPNTKSQRAIRQLPITIAKLMNIGYKYNEANTLGRDVTNIERSLKRELTLLKKEFEDNLEAVRTVTNLLNQINANDEFWEVTSLAKMFNPQTSHPDGKTIPPLDITEALRIIENER